jgi:hypothetical protein
MLQDQIGFERKTIPQAWPAEEIAELLRLRLQEGRDWSEISIRLGRSESAVKSKFKYVQHDRAAKEPAVPFVREPVPDSVLAEQARRLVAPFRDLAGAVFGDPPVGCSALDRRVRA